ncbi:MAG: carbohydrate kinase family protein [Nitrososphaerales archaeon]
MVVELVSGAINWDTSIFVDAFPKAKEEIKAKKVISVPGGKGANVAVASARILGSNNVGIIGALGDDDIAKRQIEILKDEGVDTSCIKQIQNTSSGQAYIVVDHTGENFIITYKAANHMITVDMVNDEVTSKALNECKLVTVIDPPLEVADAIITNARNLGKTVIWSPGLLVRNGFEKIRETLMKTNYIILNEPEAKILVGMENAREACLTLSGKMNGKKVIGTLGAKGCIFCWDTKTAVIPAPNPLDLELKVVNTVGAGDAFVGAFSALKIKEFGDMESLFLANIAGALKTTKEETRGSPSYKEIREYFDDKRVQSLFGKISVV